MAGVSVSVPVAGGLPPVPSPVSPLMAALGNVTRNGTMMPPLPPGAGCGRVLPHASVWLSSMTAANWGLWSVLLIICIVILAMYIEEIIFFTKVFKNGFRKKKTIWVMSIFPMWSSLAFIAICVPKAGPMIDMISNMYFGTCLYNFGKLMVHYMGGMKGLWKVIGLERRIATNTLPICCCCFCLPKMHFTPKRYFIINIFFMQVTIVRPILWFIGAVFWTNDALIPGYLSPRFSYIYVMLINLISTCTAIFALMLLRNAFRPELEKQFFIFGKFAAVQLSLIAGSTIPLIILAILIMNGVIKCSPLLSVKGMADEIYHCLVILIMLPLAILGRVAFRRVQDAAAYAQPLQPPPTQLQPLQNGAGSDMVKAPLNNDMVVEVPASGSDTNGNGLFLGGGTKHQPESGESIV